MSFSSLSRSCAPILFDDSSSDDDSHSDNNNVVVATRQVQGPTKMLTEAWKREIQHNLEASNNIINLISDSSDDEDNNTPFRLDDSSSTESQYEVEPVIPPQIYECGICFEKFLVDVADRAAAPDIMLFGAPLPCAHTYCDDCLREHTWTKLRSTDRNHIVRCPIPNCNQLITDEIAERVLRYDQIAEWYRRQVLASIENKVSHNLQYAQVDSPIV
jgi:hypothetical protein